jgi:hypothetical protein
MNMMPYNLEVMEKSIYIDTYPLCYHTLVLSKFDTKFQPFKSINPTT